MCINVCMVFVSVKFFLEMFAHSTMSVTLLAIRRLGFLFFLVPIDIGVCMSDYMWVGICEL